MSQNNKNSANTACLLNKQCDTLLYNPSLLNEPQADLLSRLLLQSATEEQRITTGGRGQAWFVDIKGLTAVYRRYMRGGFIARIIEQTYSSLSIENTRSFKEWRLLQLMLETGLPVPRPIAASVSRWPFSFSPLYQAQILVERIADVQTLDQILCNRSVDESQWASIGQCIRLFHDAGIYHADLNANNILINTDSKVFLIDFDKSEQRSSKHKGEGWKQDNIQRLNRSLLKQQGKHASYNFTEKNWQNLLKAYNS